MPLKPIVDGEPPFLGTYTAAEVALLNADLAAGSMAYVTGSLLIRVEDGATMFLEGVGTAARFTDTPPNGVTKSDLAAASGLPAYAYTAAEVQSTLDNALPMQSYAALLAYNGRATGIRITAPGIAGNFRYNAALPNTTDYGTRFAHASGTGAWERLLTGQYVTPQMFGAVGDKVADDTTALVRMHASGFSYFDYGSGQYKVSLTEGAYLLSLAGKTGVVIRGNGALIYDPLVHTLDTVTSVFWGDNTQFLSITGVNFEGLPIADKSNPTTGIGYRGATFLNLSNGCGSILVDAQLKYLRYGVRSGDYSNPSLGNNKHIYTKLNTFECGYPVAHYLAEDVVLDLVAESNHRAAYLAGVKGIRGKVLCKNQYIAPIQVLISDALVSTGVSRGCSEVDIDVVDTGSTIFVANSYLCALSLSRVDPGTTYSNIKIRSTLTGTDTIAPTISPFAIYSNVLAALPGVYPFNWEPTIFLKSIDVTVNLDRSAQTIASGTVASDLYINTIDSGVHFATVSDLRIRANLRTGSGGNPRSLYCVVPGLTGGAFVKDSNFTGYAMEYQSNTTAPIAFENCLGINSTNSFSGETSQYRFINTDIASATQPVTNARFVQSKVSGTGPTTKLIIRDVTLTGTSVNIANLVPAGSLIRGVSGRVKTAITGSSGFQVGVTGAATRYADVALTAVDSTFDPRNMLQAEADNGPRYTTVGTAFIITSKTADFTGGVLRLAISYDDMTPPN